MSAHVLFRVVEDIGQVAATAVLTVVHGSHKDAGTALSHRLACCPVMHNYLSTYSLIRALSPQALDLAITVHFVVLEHGEFGLLALMLDLLRGGVDLLLPLLASTTQAENQMERTLLLDIVVGEGSAILELLAGKNQTLLVWWDTLFVYTQVREVSQ